MRTFLFQDYLNMTNGKFLPSVTFESQEFGRHFFIDANFEFLSAPSFFKVSFFTLFNAVELYFI